LIRGRKERRKKGGAKPVSYGGGRLYLRGEENLPLKQRKKTLFVRWPKTGEKKGKRGPGRTAPKHWKEEGRLKKKGIGNKKVFNFCRAKGTKTATNEKSC